VAVDPPRHVLLCEARGGDIQAQGLGRGDGPHEYRVMDFDLDSWSCATLIGQQRARTSTSSPFLSAHFPSARTSWEADSRTEEAVPGGNTRLRSKQHADDTDKLAEVSTADKRGRLLVLGRGAWAELASTRFPAAGGSVSIVSFFWRAIPGSDQVSRRSCSISVAATRQSPSLAEGGGAGSFPCSRARTGSGKSTTLGR